MDRNSIGSTLALVLALALAVPTAHAQQEGTTAGVKEIALAAESFSRGTPAPSWVDPERNIPASSLSGPVVNLLADTQLMAQDDPGYYVHRAVVANTPLSLANVARFTIEFNPGYQRVELHALRVRREGLWLDRLANAKVTFLQRETELDFGVYTGDVTASVLMSDLRVGDVFEYEYTVRGANPVLGGRFVRNASWDQEWATELRRVILWVGPGRDVRWRLQGAGFKGTLEPEATSVGSLRRLQWQTAKLPRTEIDSGIPRSFIPYRYLAFSEFKNWADVNAWAGRLFQSAHGESPALSQLVAKLKEQPSEDERASAALTWVQTQVRYVSVSLGESSLRPAAAAVTLDRRYGDCKDKSALLVELLKGMGIRAYPVLVSARRVTGISDELPSPFSFDHAIVQAIVDGKTRYLDPTRLGQVGSVATMGQVWDLAEVLVVDERSNELTRINSETTELAADILEERLTIQKFGEPGRFTARRTWTGSFAERYRLAAAQVSNEKLEKLLFESYERRIPGFRPIGKVALQDDTKRNRLIASYEFRVPVSTVGSADRWTFRYEAGNLSQVLPLPESSRRTQPLGLPYKAAFHYDLEIEFPKTVAVTSDPTENRIRVPGLMVVRTWSFRENRAKVRFDMLVDEPQVEPGAVAQYANTARWLRNLSQSDFWVSKAAAARWENRTADATLRQEFEAQIAAVLNRVDKGLASGKLRGDDLADAYCARAVARSERGESELALAAIDSAVKISPDSSSIQRCRGSVLANADEFAESISAYSRAIVLDSGNVEAYAERGRARFHHEMFEQAIEDFAQAAKNGARNKWFSQLWLAFAQRRLGREPDEATKSWAAANSRADWPAPAIAMTYGLVTPEDVLKLVDEKKGEARDLALVEAYHAVAEWHLARGDKVKAAEYFQKTVDMGALTYVEHQSALTELRKLASH
jgi:lipoprotein NlpI/transglutaminase-like putative cysteine protease